MIDISRRDPHNLEDHLDRCILGMMTHVSRENRDLMNRVCLMHVLATHGATILTDIDQEKERVDVTIIRDLDPSDDQIFNDACSGNELIPSPPRESSLARLDAKTKLLEGLQKEISFAICEKIFEQVNSNVISGSRKVAPRGGGFSRDIFYKLSRSSYQDKDGELRTEFKLTLRSIGEDPIRCRIKQYIDADYQDQQDFNPYQTLFEIIDDHQIEIGELSKSKKFQLK